MAAIPGARERNLPDFIEQRFFVADSSDDENVSRSSSARAERSKFPQHKTRRRNVALVIFFYVVIHAISVVIVKEANYRYNFSYPMFFAMIGEFTWPFSFLLLYAIARLYDKPLMLPRGRKLVIYVCIGFGFSFSKVLLSYSLNYLPGSVFSILSSLDPALNISFSFLIIRRKFSFWHYTSVIVLISAVLTSLILQTKESSSVAAAQKHASSISGISETGALIACIFGVVEEALSTVVSDYLLKENLLGSGRRIVRSRTHLTLSQYQGNLLFIAEYSSFVSLFAFIGMLIPLAITKEYDKWPAAFRGLITGEAKPLHHAVIGMVLICMGTVACRIYMKFVKPLARIGQVLMMCWFLGEQLTVSTIIGLFAVCLAFLLYIVGSELDSPAEDESSIQNEAPELCTALLPEVVSYDDGDDPAYGMLTFDANEDIFSNLVIS